LTILREGLVKPIHFFPRASYRYAQQRIRMLKDREAALRSVVRQWDSEYAWSEADDPYVSRCFKEIDPLDSAFEELALSIFGPLLEHTQSAEIVG